MSDLATRPRARRAAGGLLAVLVAASGLVTTHLTARPASATDCVTYYCATLTVAVTGDGSTHVVDDQGEIDCYYNGNGSYFGACHVQYYWIGELSPTLPVTITSQAQPNSWVCTYYGTYVCSGVGGSRTFSVTLSRNDAAYRESEAHLGQAVTATIDAGGDGDGRVTSSPAGVDCVVTGGVASGTCQATWYFKDSLPITMTATPAKANEVCWPGSPATQCGAVGVAHSDSLTYIASASNAWIYWFQHGHPILTVSRTGSGSVVSSPAGISCPGTCSSYFPANSNVTLNAAAAAGYVFAGWTGACAAYGPTCNLSLGTTDVSTQAMFTLPASPQPSASAAATPRPTLPGPTPSLRPGLTPAPTAVSQPSQPPASGAEETEASSATSTSPAPPSGVGSADGSGASPEGPPGSPSGHPDGGAAVSPAASGPDATPLVVVGVLLLALVLVLGAGAGFLAGRGRARRQSEAIDTRGTTEQ